MAFHVIDQGGAWLRHDSAAEPVALKAGDLVVLPRGSGHQLVDHPDTLRQPLISLQASPGCPRLQLGGDGQATTLMCGYFRLLEEGGWKAHPPLTYLTQWRMRLAASLLRENVPLGEVAGRVGYESETAFSAAFKRERGVPLAQYRRSRSTSS